MKGYIQDESIILTESLPEGIRNGDEVEVVITVLKKREQPNPNTILGLADDYDHLALEWDNISDQIAFQLKTEFSAEDQSFAEIALGNCVSLTNEA